MAKSTKNTNKKSTTGKLKPVVRVENSINVSELDYSERAGYIEEHYAPFITDAQMIFSIWDSGIEYDYKADRKEVVDSIIEKYIALGDYTEATLPQETIYEIQDWTLVRKDIDPETDEVIGETELKQITSDNTYNFSYNGLVDLNWRVYHDEEYDRYFYVITPHLGGDIRGNYGDAIIIERNDKDELFYRFYKGFVSGGASIYFKFKDGSEIGFDSEQDSDVFYFRVNEGFEPTGMAQKYLNDFEKFDSWKGDEFLENTIDIYLARKGVAPKMMAGGSLNDETPKAYIQILGYNEGKYFNLTDYADGQDVIDGIYDWMNGLNEQFGGNREEYEVADYEGFGDDLYDEYMGANEFDEIIEAYEKYEGSDFPADVISAYKKDSGSGNDSLSDVIDEMDNNYFGKYDNLTDFGYEMVSQGVYTPSEYDVYITDTDKRIIAGEEAETLVDDMSFDDLLNVAVEVKSEYEDEKSELEDKITEIEQEIQDLTELQKSSDDDEYETISESIEEKEIELDETQNELDEIDSRYEDKAREEAKELYYDEIYDKLENDLEGWLSDYGYNTDNLADISFVSVDYQKIGKEISSDYLVIEFEGDLYFFNNYAKGGRITASKRKPKYAYYIVENSTKKLVSGYSSKTEAIEQRKLLIQQYPSMRFEIYPLANLEAKTDLDVYAKKDYVELSTLDKIKKVSVDAYRYGKDKVGQAQVFLERNDVKGKIKRGARKVADKTKQGASWLQKQWREADFGDGKGKAKFFADGGRVGKMYYHILEYGNYGNIGYHGYYENLQDAEKEVKRLKDYFPNLDFQIFTDKSRKEPPITTMANGGLVENQINELYNRTNFIGNHQNWKIKLLEMLQDESIEAYNIYQSLTEEQKEELLQELFEMDNDMGSDGDGEIETSKENLNILLDGAKKGKKYRSGGVTDEVAYLEGRIYNLEELVTRINEEDKPEMYATINKLKQEKENLIKKRNNPELEKVKPKKSFFGLFEKGGEMKLPKDNSKVHFTDDQNREYDGRFIKDENMFYIGFEDRGDFRYSFEIIDWKYINDVDSDAHAKHEASETAEEEKAEHEYDVYDNKRMLKNQAKEVEHHSEELNNQVEITKRVPAWVIAKMERATTDLSDITHYLDGENKMANGGELGSDTYYVVPNKNKFAVVKITYREEPTQEDKHNRVRTREYIYGFDSKILEFDDINSAKNFIKEIKEKHPYGVPKANAGMFLIASELLKQKQSQQPQIVYYIPRPVEKTEDVSTEIVQNIPEMAYGGELDNTELNDFCIINLIELANEIQPVRYFLTDRFKETDVKYKTYKGKLVIVFKEPASLSVINAINNFIERAEDCHNVLEQSVNVSGSKPSSVSINILSDKFSDREYNNGGKVYDYPPKKINIEKTKKIKTHLGDYNLGLITNDFVYFVNTNEEDENAQTIMYSKNGELLSDNIHATNDLFQALETQDDFEFIHPEMEVYRKEKLNKN